jgi:hypothetical protein
MRYITILFVLLMIASAADRDLAGRYAGEWKSNSSGGNGSFRMSLDPAPGGAWKCEVTFTFAGEEVKTIVRQVKVDQSKLEAAYDFDLLGGTLRSRITGDWNGKAFEGRYQTTAVEGGAAVDDGVWSAARAK